MLVAGGIVVLDVGADGALARRETGWTCRARRWRTWSSRPTAPPVRHLEDGRVFGFDVAADGSPTRSAPASVPTGTGDHARRASPSRPTARQLYVAAGSGLAAGAASLGFAIGAGRTPLTPAAARSTLAAGPWYLSASPDGRSLFAAGDDGHLFDLGARGALAAEGVPRPSTSGDPSASSSAPTRRRSRASPRRRRASRARRSRFDASGAVDPDGTIARYDWDFGDGTLLPTAGPPRARLHAARAPTVVLVVTDNEGASTPTVFTGGTVLGNGDAGAPRPPG